MKKKRSSPGCCEHPEEQMSLTGFCEIPHIEDDYKTKCGPVSRFLLPGRSNAISLKTLERWIGLDQRTIRQRISDERKKLVPIVHDNKTGYFLAETKLEKDHCVREMYHRAEEIRRAAEAINQASLWRG